MRLIPWSTNKIQRLYYIDLRYLQHDYVLRICSILLLDWVPTPGDDVAPNLHWLWELHTKVQSLIAPNLNFPIISYLESVSETLDFFAVAQRWHI